MKMWGFTFCSPNALLQSARVAAPNKAIASGLLQALTDEDVESGDDPSERVIVQYIGETQKPACVVSLIRRGGDEAAFA